MPIKFLKEVPHYVLVARVGFQETSVLFWFFWSVVRNVNTGGQILTKTQVLTARPLLWTASLFKCPSGDMTQKMMSL